MRTVTLLTLSLLLGGCVHTAHTAPPKPTIDVQPEKTTEPKEEATEATEATTVEALETIVLTEAPPLPEYNSDDVNLAKRILKLKRSKIWFECGKKYKKSELENAALDWAIAINTAADATPEYQLRSGTYVKPDIREALGIMQNESRFDRCAVGPYPRIYAYKNGILKRKPNTLSHSLDELQQAIKHKGFKRRKADLGPGQIVVYIGNMSWDEISAYLSLTPGITKVFDAMVYRGKLYNTSKPSYHWPGSRRHYSYYRKIMRGIMRAFPEIKYMKFK